jgi:hypothetical protein
MDAYTPLLELKDRLPPIGYTVPKGTQIMPIVATLCSENLRAPLVPVNDETTVFSDFVSSTDDTWLSFLSDLIANAKFEFALDEMGRILFSPVQDATSLQPVWTYNDDNSSILYPNITVDRDVYGIPNVVEVVYSSSTETYYSRVENNDSNSPISTATRGREVMHRVTNPEISGNPTQEQIDSYAKQLLRNLSALEFTITYTHGYCPVRVGDCVYLNYERAGLRNVKAKVISQSIKCETGCSVEETATSNVVLWGG